MVDRVYGVKQSNFTAQTSIVSGSYIGFFANGYNYKITYDNFLSGLGVTGTIVQDGAVTGVPVLDVDGSINNIRNLEAGTGIAIEVSAENGITIEQSYTIDTTGEPLMQNITAATPTFVSLVAGAGIELATVGSTVEVSSIEAASYASVTMQGNATATVIAATATPVKAAGTFVVGDVLDFTADATGKITHTGVAGRHVINATVTVDVASGTNHKISLYIAKNGSVIANSKMSDTVSTGLVRSLATFLNLEMQPADYFEIFVRNESTTDDITVVNAMLSAL